MATPEPVAGPLPLDGFRVLDLTAHRAGPTAARQLADWSADVVLENYRSNVKYRLGVDYESVKKVNPRSVYSRRRCARPRNRASIPPRSSMNWAMIAGQSRRSRKGRGVTESTANKTLTRRPLARR
jgi:hypothetical protein